MSTSKAFLNIFRVRTSAITNEGSLTIGADADTQNISVGTDNTARTITLGNTTGGTGVVVNTGTSGLTIRSTGALSLPKAAVTQGTNIATAVTIDAPSGVITTQTSTLGAGQAQSFTVNNSTVTSTSTVLVTVTSYSGTFFTNGVPIVQVRSVTNGSFVIAIANVDARDPGATALNGVFKIAFLVC